MALSARIREAAVALEAPSAEAGSTRSVARPLEDVPVTEEDEGAADAGAGAGSDGWMGMPTAMPPGMVETMEKVAEGKIPSGGPGLPMG